MAKTKIEWTEQTWNPIAGCSLESAGCTNCYAMKMAARLERIDLEYEARHGAPGPHAHYIGLTQPSKAGPVWTGKIGVAGDGIFLAPLRRKKPTDYFVNSMADLFHPDVPDDVIDRLFAVMALCPQHTFKVLTKRAERMREYANDPATIERVWQALQDLLDDWYDGGPVMQGIRLRIFRSSSDDIGDALLPVLSAHGATWGGQQPWPISNVWLGVSVEDQRRAERIDHLRNTPAAKRFISFEPLIADVGEIDLTGIDWAIIGGESGPNARPMHPDWARSLRDQCAAAGTAFFFKQWGEFWPWEGALDTLPGPLPSLHGTPPKGVPECPTESDKKAHWWPLLDENMLQPFSYKVGKHPAGRTLDGVIHHGMPS